MAEEASSSGYWQVKLPNGEPVRLDRLPAGKIIDWATEERTHWSLVLDAPTVGTGSLMSAIYRTLCADRMLPVDALMSITDLAECFEFIPGSSAEEADDTDAGDEDPSTPDAAA